MPHELSEYQNEAGETQHEMAYAGEKPWHGLGVEVPGLMSVDEALTASHTDWAVEKVPCLSSYDMSPIEGKYATIRKDTGKPLGVVGEVYQPLQNRDAFRFMDTILGSGQAQIETVGALRGGKTVWAMAKMPESFEAVEGDEVKPYLLISNTHDGTKPAIVQFTTIRVVCNNTLTVAIHNGKKNSIRLKHTTTIDDRLEIAALTMSGAIAHFEEMREVVKQMARTSVSRVEVGAFMDAMFPQRFRKRRGSDQIVSIENKDRTKVTELIETGLGSDIPGVRGTLWGTYNAYTEWLDHHARTVGGTERFDRTQFGGGVQMRQKAFNTLVGMM